MGTWGTGPFDNDTAADFSHTLDDAASGDREQVLRGVLTRTVEAAGYLTEAEEAVAAAALIAARCPGGRPIDTVYGPKQPTPDLPGDVRALAAAALDRVTADQHITRADFYAALKILISEAAADPLRVRGPTVTVLAIRSWNSVHI